MRFAHVVFDVDGTLVDSERVNTRVMQVFAREALGRDFAAEEVAFTLGITTIDAVRAFGVKDEEGALRRLEEISFELSGGITVFEGIPELLDRLAEKGVELGIATSRNRSEFTHDIEPLGFSDRFGHIILLEDSATHKPEPGPMLEYLRQSGADPAETLFVGDTEADCSCAHGAGVAFALAGWGATSDVPEADHVLQSPGELLAL